MPGKSGIAIIVDGNSYPLEDKAQETKFIVVNYEGLAKNEVYGFNDKALVQRWMRENKLLELYQQLQERAEEQRKLPHAKQAETNKLVTDETARFKEELRANGIQPNDREGIIAHIAQRRGRTLFLFGSAEPLVIGLGESISDMGGFNGQAASAYVDGGIYELFENPGYTGNSIVLIGTPPLNIPDLGAPPWFFNNRASSVIGR